MNKLKIAVDIDGVLRDFTHSLNKAYNEAHPGAPVMYPDHKDFGLHKLYPIGKDIYDFVWKTHAWDCLFDADPFEGAIEFMQELKTESREIILLTAQPTPEAKMATMDWIYDQGLLEVVDDIVIISGGKDNLNKALIPSVNILVDDYIKNLECVQWSGIFPICFTRPWNSKWTGTRVANYEELLIAIEKIEKKTAFTKRSIVDTERLSECLGMKELQEKEI